jgi:ribosomal protein S18 acetylase RimI-like enzyme
MMSRMAGVTVDGSLAGVDWVQCKRDLMADDFDNGRSPDALERAFRASQHVAIARAGERVVGMARLLSDGVSNAYLLDVWTQSAYRRRGIGRAMVEALCDAVPGQHVGLQTSDQVEFYASMGFGPQPQFLSKVVGRWLDNDANRQSATTR